MILPKLQPRAEAMNFDREQLFCLYSATHDDNSGLRAISPEVDQSDCDFIITRALKAGNYYQLCVKATQGVGSSTHKWELTYGLYIDAQTTTGLLCFDSIPANQGQNAVFEVTHWFNEANCQTSFNIGEPDCDEDVITTEVINCDNLATELNINLSKISTPYVISYGSFPSFEAGESSAAQVIHYFSTPGIYEVCLTYQDDGDYVTCCFPLTISNESGVDCGFIVTKATKEGNSYTVCVQANDQNGDHTWMVDGIIMSENGANECFTTSSQDFYIRHEVDPPAEGGCYVCEKNILIETSPDCPKDIISAFVEDCEFQTSLEIDVESIVNPPYVIDFGDGSLSEQSEGSTITHVFDETGTYNMCLTYQGDGRMRYNTCCYEVEVYPDCCVDPSFELSRKIGSSSCYNPEYEISHIACTSSNFETQHIWKFSDSTVYYGLKPPDHLFTNLLITNGQVCVTHTIICCENEYSSTECVNHSNGAFLGTPMEDIHFSDILPFTNDNVLNFIQLYAGNPLYPLFIDGRLIADLDGSFIGGAWNMGKNSEIFLAGKTYSFRNFGLDGTVIQSAVRTGYATCCRWNGIRSNLATSIDLRNATIKDAKYAIRYVGKKINEDGFVTPPNVYPKIKSQGATFLNNLFGIKSEYQYVVFTDFRNNTMNGVDVPHVCGCDAVNAIDFRGINDGMAINIVPSVYEDYNNHIWNYEQGFHFDNASLKVRGFVIDSLRNYDDIITDFIPKAQNNPSGFGAIGIDFINNQYMSSLNLDFMKFMDFEALKAKAVAVRDSIIVGHHTLTAEASSLGSISASGLAGGYEMSFGSLGNLKGTISNNVVSTNGGPYGFGITGKFLSHYNNLEVKKNKFNINSGSISTYNGGVYLNGVNGWNQSFDIYKNDIEISLAKGPGIGIAHAYNSKIRNNTLTNSTLAPGILLLGGGDALVKCNDIQWKQTGISVQHSVQNTYTGNSFLANKTDIEFMGNLMGANGTLIQWNTFDNSIGPSLYYYNGTITGKQTHNRYNKWLTQTPGGVEAKHGGTPLQVSQSAINYPLGELLGHDMHPNSFPNLLFNEAGSSTIKKIPFAYCNEIDPDVPDGLTNSDDEWDLLVQDTGWLSGLTDAERVHAQQELYGLLLENPDWLTGHAGLSSFKLSKTAGFVGQSESLKHDWQALLSQVYHDRESLQPTYNLLDSLSEFSQELLYAVHADTSLFDSLGATLSNLLTTRDSLISLINHSDSLLLMAIQDSVGVLLLKNAALDDGEWYEWCEKRYNEIGLNWLGGVTPDSAAITDIRQIAQSCIRHGGRAVLGARGLCATWLREYYDEDGCIDAVQERSAAQETDALSNVELQLVPNPANDRMQLYFRGEQSGDWSIRIYSLSGREVYAGQAPSDGELIIQTGTWPNGQYLIKAAKGNQFLSRSFIIQHP